jgi:phosphoribosylformylglycinamidine synthase subunit PurQ / glutaminase
VMESIAKEAADGLPVLGICNGFQILCEAHLLPGALTRNQHLHFRNRDQKVRILTSQTSWTRDFVQDQEIVIPVKNGEGCFVGSEELLDQLEANDQVVARYVGENPNGSMRDIAAIRNEAGNVVGIMPHPEHAIDLLTGPSVDGLGFFTSVLKALSGTGAAARPALTEPSSGAPVVPSGLTLPAAPGVPGGTA